MHVGKPACMRANRQAGRQSDQRTLPQTPDMQLPMISSHDTKAQSSRLSGAQNSSLIRFPLGPAERHRTDQGGVGA